MIYVIVAILGFVFGDAASVFAGAYLNKHYLKEGYNPKNSGEDNSPLEVDYYITKARNVNALGTGNIIMGVITGGLWLLIYVTGSDIISVVLYVLVSLVLLILATVDWLVYEIPFVFVICIGVLGMVRLFTDLVNWPLYVIGTFTVSGIFLIVQLATKGRGMGGGDVKLMAALGLLFGWKVILVCMLIGCILGAVIHSIRRAVLKDEPFLAFGPYLAMAAAICMCYGSKLADLYFSYYSVAVK